MRHYSLLIVLLGGSALRAQDLIPRPYVYFGPEGMSAGYSPVALLAGAGLRIDSRHFIFDANANYDNGHKTNDNTGINEKGHDRGLVGSMYYRLPSGWAFGGGARWSQLSTTNYKKSAWRPTFGGSRDFFVRDCLVEGCRHAFTMRIGADYVLPGTDWQNGSQGPSISFYLPSPSARRHLFFREVLGIYRYHDTVTDRTDPILTRLESSRHGVDSFLELTLMYRF